MLLYRVVDDVVQVLIAHPGGPFWARKDDGAWSIPKGEYQPDEAPWAAAQREFTEEMGSPPPDGPRRELTPVRQSGGKIVTVFAIRGDFDADGVTSNTVTIEWPRGTGRFREFPEIDRAGWFAVGQARMKLIAGQRPLLDELMAAPELTGYREGPDAAGAGSASRSR